MKTNSLKKTFSFLAAFAVAGSAMTSSINTAHAKTISSHKSILVGQTITVNVKKGEKQKSSNRKIATVSKKYTKKRKKVTVRKKGKKIRKWKTVKAPNGKFAIRGIRAGKATITIRSGKKTYKFKVTVKNRPASKTSTSSSSSSHSSGSVTTNPRPAGMTMPDGPVVSEFSIDRAKYQNAFYSKNTSNVIIRWKTNLKSDEFCLYDETENTVAGRTYILKKRYNNVSELFGSGVVTNDGYAFVVSAEKAGTHKYSIAISGGSNNFRIEKTGYGTTVTFNDYDAAEKNAITDLINRSGADNSKLTVKEKLQAIAIYMATGEWENGSFIHPGNAEQGEYMATYGDVGVWFQSRVITCVDATGIIMKCALKLGVPKQAMGTRNPVGPQYGSNHVLNTFNFNGDYFEVDGSPLTFIRK